MHVYDIAKQLPFPVENWEIEYLTLVSEYKKSPAKAIKQIRQKVRKASNVASLCLFSVRHNSDDLEPVDDALFESCNKLFTLSEEIRQLEKLLAHIEEMEGKS
ncbi:MAG: hypothetical protein ACRCR4_05130 [Thiotrichaceae bacterium]